jgi:undecaprenyl pyrophosphate phosphatase UppP
VNELIFNVVLGTLHACYLHVELTELIYSWLMQFHFLCVLSILGALLCDALVEPLFSS